MLTESLHTHFGFDRFLKGQREILETVVAGGSAAAIFPTGAGKSLCYQLPALHLPGLTLVVSPLLSLMKDQLDFLLERGIAAAKLDSAMTAEAFNKALDDAKCGRVRILMISVERFKNERFRGHLRKMPVSLLVVDEAHCISEWGHNFRPDYLKIPLYREEFGIPQVLLLTATATPAVIADMQEKFAIPADHVVVTGFYRENLQIEVRPAASKDKARALIDRLRRPPVGPAIVYVTLQQTAERVAGKLAAAGMRAAAYHAGMTAERRESVQNRFMQGELDTVAATIAFGMGIDKRDIRKVVHYDLPKSIESYSQEIGRAGRDGALSVCTVLGNRADVPVLENFAYGDTPEKQAIGKVLTAIDENDGPTWEVRLNALSRETDIRLLPLKTLLVYLEMEGVIEPRYTYFERYPFRFVDPPETIAARFQGERRRLVETLFRHCRTARVWTEPDIEAVVGESGADRRRVLAALDYFDGRGWIALQPKTRVEVFAIRAPRLDVTALTERLFARFRRREAYEIRRIQEMVTLFETAPCLALALSAYFGEQVAAPCGRCTGCQGETGRTLPDAEHPLPSDEELCRLIALLGEQIGPPRPSPAQAARFLCGITSPRLTAGRATRLAGFGRLGGCPYRAVTDRVENLLDRLPRRQRGANN